MGRRCIRLIKAGVVGGTGYGGRELIRLVSIHPHARLEAVASSSSAGQPLGEVLPAFRKTTEVICEAFDAEALAARCDVVFLAVPSKESMPFGAALRKAGARVIDIGADFRLKDTALFKQYYKAEHTASEWLPESVYGLVPQTREALRHAKLVAAPGCYPISVLIPLLPLLDGPIGAIPIVIDAISGTSGAGKSLSEALHFSEMNENVWAYKLAVHQHVPEIEQQLGNRVTVQFTPHVGPYQRGILSTITVRPDELFDPAPFYAAYAGEPFVRVLGEGALPELKYVRGSNFCDFGWVRDGRTGNLIIVSAIDNLVGGTAGMSIQCMNVMFGLEETAGLLFGGMTP